jgi:hypothetical protein
MQEHQADRDPLSHLLARARTQLRLLVGRKACEDPPPGNRDNVGNRDNDNGIPNWQEASWPQTGSWHVLLTARTAAGL